MKTQRIFLALFALPLFLLTSCIEENNGLVEYDEFGNALPSEAVLNGTGLPRLAELDRVVYLAEKEEIVSPLGHIEIGFGRNCAGEWCSALLDDCGINSDIDYSVEEVENANQKITFRNVESSWSMQQFAEDNLQFEVHRDGAQLSFTCADCPGQTWDGTEYQGRRVEMTVHR